MALLFLIGRRFVRPGQHNLLDQLYISLVTLQFLFFLSYFSLYNKFSARYFAEEDPSSVPNSLPFLSLPFIYLTVIRT